MNGFNNAWKICLFPFLCGNAWGDKNHSLKRLEVVNLRDFWGSESTPTNRASTIKRWEQRNFKEYENVSIQISSLKINHKCFDNCNQYAVIVYGNVQPI